MISVFDQMAQYFRLNFNMGVYIILFLVAISSAEEEFEDYSDLYNLPIISNTHESSPEGDTAEKVFVFNH